jgi:predicted O-methyltransferase YrrM
LIFIDADKPNYLKYYNQAMDCLNVGGYVIADNVLWSGKVVDENSLQKDKDTQLLDSFNKHLHNDQRLEHILLPIRDGLMMGRKISD